MHNKSHSLNWLDGNLDERLVQIRKYIKSLDSSGSYVQCKHGDKHCKSIEDSIHHLLPEQEHWSDLKLKERFFLLASPWIMNIAWNQEIGKSETFIKSRDWLYHEIGHNFLYDKGNLGILQIDQDEARVFQYTILYHSLTKNIEECPKILTVGPERIRVRLLTAYLRLADAIHVDESGGPTSLFYYLQDPNSPELFHWIKSRLQLMIQPNPHLMTIEVYVSRNIDFSEHLINRVLSELELHVALTKNTLTEHGITNYIYVKSKQSDTPIPSEKKVELEKLVKEYAMSFPPNAGMLQSLYLSSVEDIARREDGKFDVVKEIEQLQEIAKKAYQFRPCHIALHKYIGQLDAIIKGNNKELVAQKVIEWVDRCKGERAKRLSEIYEIASEELKVFDNFLLFGYSSTVTESLGQMYKKTDNKKSINIYVCEAHNKSRFDASKRLIYIDGVNYAKKIKTNLKRAKIKLIPDITVASIFKSNQNARWVVLFGANGITPQADCGHSAGHLSLAIIAKYFGIPVYILCDSYKIGYKIGELVRKKPVERKDQWLECVPCSSWYQNNELGYRYANGNALPLSLPPHYDDFDLQNLRESVIESSLIERIVTEDGSYDTRSFIDRYSNV